MNEVDDEDVVESEDGDGNGHGNGDEESNDSNDSLSWSENESDDDLGLSVGSASPPNNFPASTRPLKLSKPPKNYLFSRRSRFISVSEMKLKLKFY